MDKPVDTRKLKNGQIRLRFRLSPEAVLVVKKALSITSSAAGLNVKGEGAKLEILAIEYASDGCPKISHKFATTGSGRLLFRLYPDQFANVIYGLALAKSPAESDADVLVRMALHFLSLHGHQD